MSIFVFDIETVPDVATGQEIYDLQGLTPAETAEAMMAKRREKTGSDFLPHYLQRIVAISVVLRFEDQVKVWSLGEEDASEADIIQRFFTGVERYQPTLVTWNGSGFDLPVLHYRALKHGITAAQYWEMGDNDRDYRFNNYISRYHFRHIDVMDVLASYQPRANAPLDHIAQMLGFPGKMGMGGDKVWPAYLNGEIKKIRDYCETDVLNTYLVYLAFQKMRGILNETSLKHEHDLLRQTLAQSSQAHLKTFLNTWEGQHAA